MLVRIIVIAVIYMYLWYARDCMLISQFIVLFGLFVNLRLLCSPGVQVAWPRDRSLTFTEANLKRIMGTIQIEYH